MRRTVHHSTCLLALLLAPAPASASVPGVGLSPVRSLFLENPTIGDTGPQEGDGFGFALAAGDFDGDGRDELAIGHVGVGGFAGAVTALRGALFADGFESDGDQYRTIPVSSLEASGAASSSR